MLEGWYTWKHSTRENDSGYLSFDNKNKFLKYPSISTTISSVAYEIFTGNFCATCNVYTSELHITSMEQVFLSLS